MYKIRWTSKSTNATGTGATTFSKEEAERIAKSLNNKPFAICTHYVVRDDSIVEKSEMPTDQLSELNP